MNTPNSNSFLEDAQLQQELRQMFDLDSQKYLESYLNLVQQLNPQSWQADIQEIYRSIHTIKGGAVTVGANAILAVAIALEDLLSDLRYLNPAPPLNDGQLNEILLTAGELLASSFQLEAEGEETEVKVKPIAEAVTNLRTEIHQIYLPNWSQQQQLCEEFANQVFDLVVLELEMALEQLNNESSVPPETVEIARSTLEKLWEIGIDLELAPGWTAKINKTSEILTRLESDYWLTQWSIYLKELKECVRNGGKLLPLFPQEQQTLVQTVATETDTTDQEEEESVLTEEDLTDLDLDIFEDLDGLFPVEANSDLLDLLNQEDFFAEETEEPTAINTPKNTSKSPSEITRNNLITDSKTSNNTLTEKYQETQAESNNINQPLLENDIQIPVPLRRLDETAALTVESILATRAFQGLYSNLQSMLTKLFALAQENAQYITSLRQIQDEYALLSNLNNEVNNSSDSLNLEHYRQGYTSINRLLENSLRLSEIGEEATKTAMNTQASIKGLERNIQALQQTVEASRLVPFKNLCFRARAIIRDLQTRYDKPVSLIVKGEQIELDAGTSSKLEPALLHLLRNAFDHGLESPSERVFAGKPEQGKIILSLQRRGNNYLLDLEDDGRGIDPQKIAQIAQTKGLPLTNTETPDQLLAVICQPGFSSQDQVSDVSGRGVGMDVVANQVLSLGGKLSLTTTVGVGTTFKLLLPVPHLLVPCVLLKVGSGVGFSSQVPTFAIPVEDIVTTTLFGSLKTQEAQQGNLFTHLVEENTGLSAGLDLLKYWVIESEPRQLSELAISVYVRSATSGAWFFADELLGQTDLLIDPLPSPLVAPIGLMGVSLQFDGSLIPVLDATSIVESLQHSAVKTHHQEVKTHHQKVKTHHYQSDLEQTILVVDDAALIRRRIEASLTASGYIVYTCADGEEAWSWIQNNPTPALVITDIEMPRLDGFTLIDRSRKSGITIPMLVISSRLSEEWGKEAHRVGATDYLTKGFSTPELINKVKSLLDES